MIAPDVRAWNEAGVHHSASHVDVEPTSSDDEIEKLDERVRLVDRVIDGQADEVDCPVAK